jgi:hypothetical protein
MAIASRILGDEVGSTAPAFLAFLAVHVIAGLTAVITGAAAAVARKGSPRHVRAGRWYYRAITAVFATATALAAMRWAQDWYLFVLGAVAFTAATAGYLHRRRHRPGDTGHIAGMGIAYTAMVTALYVDNGPHLPLWDRLPTPGLLDPARRHRRPPHHPRDLAREEVTDSRGLTGPGQARHTTPGAEAELSTGYAFTCGPVRRRSRWPRPGGVPGRAGARRRLRRIRR